MAFDSTSPAFAPGAEIPRQYTCLGENISPPLGWSGAPAGTRSFILALLDPDAPTGTFHHWAIYDIPSGTDQLDPGTGAGHGPPGLREAINDYGKRGYSGPCPPPGHGVHHYRFRLAALSVERLDLPDAAKVQEAIAAARPYAIAQTELVGTFQR